MSRDWNIVDDDDAADAPREASAGLDARRVRVIVDERRAANRARVRRRVIGIVALAIANASAVRAAIAWRSSPAFSLACAMTAAAAAVIAFRAWRTGDMSVEISPANTTNSPPDFDSLGCGDGDAAARLGRMRGES